jgi:hypothetical protein
VLCCGWEGGCWRSGGAVLFRLSSTLGSFARLVFLLGLLSRPLSTTVGRNAYVFSVCSFDSFISFILIPYIHTPTYSECFIGL